MNTRRMAVTGLAAACFALTACATSNATPTSGQSSPALSSPALSGKDALISALATIGSTSYNVTITQGTLNGTGAVDPVAKNATVDVKGLEQGTNVEIQALQFGADLYGKFDLGSAGDAQFGIDPTKWMKVDQSKLTGPNAKPFDLTSGDALDVAGLVAGLNSVQQTDATHLAGTVDLTKATGASAPSAGELTTAGAPAKTTPFTATLDGQGRLVELKVDADSFNKDLTFDIAFSAFGSATPISAPAASDIIPAPDAVYQIMNG